MTIQEILAARAKLVADARKMVETAKGENRDLTPEENGAVDKMLDDAEGLRKQAEDAEQTVNRTQRLDAAEADLAKPRGSRVGPMPDRQTAGGDGNPRATPEYRAAFQRWLQFGQVGMNAREVRALTADNDAQGGYLYPDTTFVNSFIQAVDNATVIRGRATVMRVTGSDALGCPALDTDASAAEWTSELLTGTADTSLSFGKRELRPWDLVKKINVSRKLLSRAANAEGIVRDRLSYQIGIAQENAFMTGTGANRPLGLFTASASGINTDRDVSTDNFATAMTADGLRNAKYTLKSQYWPRAVWLFHRDAVKQISKMTDADGQYLWQPSLAAGDPDTLLGNPMLVSEYVPNTFTTGLYVGMFGDLSNYWIADADPLEVMRNDYENMGTNQVTFYLRMATDGMPVLAEAFVRVKLG